MKISTVRVFVDEHKNFGNPVGIVLDLKKTISEEDRQKTVTKLNYSEVVFIDSLSGIPTISIYNPQGKVAFAGHAVLGTAYYIKNMLKIDIEYVKSSGKKIKVIYNNTLTYIEAPLSTMPDWNFKQLVSFDEIENLTKKIYSKMKHTYVWAWLDEGNGLVRARTFAPDWGIPEDQANGSGSMLLASKLNRNLKIHHGDGSIIYAGSVNRDLAKVGGLCYFTP